MISSTPFPPGYDYTLQNNARLYGSVASKIQFQPHVSDAVEPYKKRFEENVLGIQFRAQEIRYF